MSIKPTSLTTKYLLFIFLLIALAIGELGRFYLGGNLYITLLDIAVVFFVVTVSMKKLFSNPLKRTYSMWTLFVFFTMIFTTLIRINEVPLQTITVAMLYPLRWLLYMLIPIGVMDLGVKKTLASNYIRVFVLLACIGFVQILVFPNLGFIEQYGFDPHYLRLVSSWLDPNFVGVAFVLGMLVVLSEKKNSANSILLVAIVFIALLLTFSRSSYILFTVSGLLFAALRRSWRIGLFVVLGTCLLYLSFTIPRQNLEKSRNIDRVVSANSRLTSYAQGIDLFSGRPLLGIGYNLIRYEKAQRGMLSDATDGGNSGAGIDSSWIAILATTGIVGLLIFIAYWIRMLYLLFEPAKITQTKLIKASFGYLKKATAYEHAMLAFTLGWFIHTWFVNSLFFSPIIALWGVGMGIALQRKTTDYT